MINKQFLLYRTKAEFEQALRNGDINRSSIVFIKNPKYIWTQGEYFTTTQYQEIYGTPNIPKKISDLVNDVDYTTTDDLQELQDNILSVNNEDITSVAKNLKFANKKYDPENYSGLGRMYLRKNFFQAELTEVVNEDGITFEDGVWGKQIPASTIFGTTSVWAYLSVNHQSIANNSNYVITLTKYKDGNVAKSMGIGIFNEEISANHTSLSGWFRDSYIPFVVDDDYDIIILEVKKQNGEEMNQTDVVTLSIKTRGTGNNALVQGMINKPNTIYHIQYDYDLNGQTITVPEGCVLIFKGGSFKNGTLIGNDTPVYSLIDSPFDGITYSGLRLLYKNTNPGGDSGSSTVVNYTREDFLQGNYWEFEDENYQTVTVATTTPSPNEGFQCFRVQITAGSTIFLKTIGGQYAARAYAITDGTFNILDIPARGVADFSLGKTLYVNQDGWLFVNAVTSYDPVITITTESSSTAKTISSKIYNPILDFTKGNIKVLDIGNSFTDNATVYLPELINSASITADFSIYKATRDSGSFKTWYDCYNDNDASDKTIYISKAAGASLSSVTTGSSPANDGTLFRNTLNNTKWDLIIIHQVSTASTKHTSWENTTSDGYLKEFIRMLKISNPQAKIGFLMIHSFPGNNNSNPAGSSDGHWQMLTASTRWIMNNYGIDFVIPYGTAVQNIRQISGINSDELSSDGWHLASGLGCYTACCCYFQQLISAICGTSVYGNSYRVAISNPSKGQVSVDDTKALLAQKAAVLACTDMFTINNPETTNI